MRKLILRSSRSTWLSRVLLVLTIGCFSRPTFASSDVQLITPVDTATTSLSVTSLPDAPSAFHPDATDSIGAGIAVPLEQQDHPPVTPVKVPLNIGRDLINIAVSPAYIRKNDLKWLLPVAGAAAAAFATDTHTMTQVVSSNPSFNQINVDMSNGLVGGFIAAPVAIFGIGQYRHEERMRETGILGSEAMVDAYVVDQVIKLCTFRERPNVDNGSGKFFVSGAGWDSSFVSAHSMLAWSSAAVIAGEYPSKWLKLGVYSLAAGVGVARIMGQQHFPSDVLLGATGGWLIGHYVFRAHHHPPLQHAAK